MSTSGGKKMTNYPEIHMQKINLTIGENTRTGLTFENSLMEKHVSRLALSSILP